MSRPQFNPTQEQRALVKSMAAMGIPHEDIARKIGVRSPKTLRKHFHDELDLGAMEANYKVLKTLFEMATSGEHPARQFSGRRPAPDSGSGQLLSLPLARHRRSLSSASRKEVNYDVPRLSSDCPDATSVGRLQIGRTLPHPCRRQAIAEKHSCR
jgi:hypothetical protein